MRNTLHSWNIPIEDCVKPQQKRSNSQKSIQTDCPLSHIDSFTLSWPGFLNAYTTTTMMTMTAPFHLLAHSICPAKIVLISCKCPNKIKRFGCAFVKILPIHANTCWNIHSIVLCLGCQPTNYNGRIRLVKITHAHAVTPNEKLCPAQTPSETENFCIKWNISPSILYSDRNFKLVGWLVCVFVCQNGFESVDICTSKLWKEQSWFTFSTIGVFDLSFFLLIFRWKRECFFFLHEIHTSSIIHF